VGPPAKTRQRIAAEATQQAIIEAATQLFTHHGYHATAIGSIASEAGVAVQTIYNSVGSKREVLSRVLDFAAAGVSAPTPVAQSMREQAERATNPGQILDELVEFWRGALPRTAPIFRVIREAAASDPAVAALERRRSSQRLRNYGEAAGLLAERGVLRAALTIDDAAATIFAIGHPETYRSLVLDGEWEETRWATWARDALGTTLLQP
jgi:AcrR family transcriptional regulator